MPEFEYVGSELDVFALATNWKRYFSAALRPFVSGEVLEVGAGIGETTRAMWHPGVRHWVCLEPDARLAERLADVRLEGKTAPEVIVGVVETLPPARQFDTILYIDVLEHIANDRAELAAAASHLRPGGHLVVLSPAFNQLYSPFDKAIGHHRRYTSGSLSAVFPQQLIPRRRRYLDSVALLLSLANKLLLRQSMPTRRQILFWDRILVPIARVVDPLVMYRLGRSVIAVYQAGTSTV